MIIVLFVLHITVLLYVSEWNQLLLPPGSHFDCTCDISLRCRDMLLDGVYHVGATGVKVVVLNGQMVSDDVFK